MNDVSGLKNAAFDLGHQMQRASKGSIPHSTPASSSEREIEKYPDEPLLLFGRKWRTAIALVSSVVSVGRLVRPSASNEGGRETNYL